MRFRVSHNGSHACTCGVDGDGVVDVVLSFVKRPGEASELKLMIGGAEIYGDRAHERRFTSWASPQVATGDSVEINLLAPGRFDTPLEQQEFRSTSTEDVDFGEVHFECGAWFGRFTLESDQSTEVRFRCRSDETGISEDQRKRLLVLRRDYSLFWPAISDALIACHRQLQSAEDLASQVKSFVCVDLLSVADDETALSYEFTNCSKRYHVTLRDGRVVENYALE